MTDRQREAGQALVLVVLGIVVLIGALGLGIDMGYYRYQKRQLQTAADSAALAGAQVLPVVASVPTAANQALTNNGYGASSGTTALIHTPPSCTTAAPCNLPVTDPNQGKTQYVEVVLTQNQPTFFSKIFGVTSVPLTARAEAESNRNCIYALDTSKSGAITVGPISLVTTDCGVVDESSSGTAFECIAGSLVAPSIEVVGGKGGFFCFGGTAPRLGITLPATPYDPMKYLQSSEPSTLPCGITTSTPFHGSPAGSVLTIGGGKNPGPNVLYADGAYCGGISVQNGGQVTFSPSKGSTYQLGNCASVPSALGGLNIGPLTTVDGSAGVTFYNCGGTIQFTFTSVTAGTVLLFAPSSGPLTGVLFFQPPGNTNGATIIGAWSGNTRLTGGYYMPGAALTYAFDFGTNSAGDYAPIVVKDLNFIATGSFSTASVYSLAPSGVSPLRAQNAVLVE